MATSTPASGPVLWRAVYDGTTVEVSAQSWFLARRLAAAALGAPPEAIDPKRADEGEGRGR
jgi:hypothetical protein